MKQLIAGRSGLVGSSPAKAVRTLMQKRVAEGTLERPDIEAPGVAGARPKVKVHAPKVAAFIQRQKKPPITG